MMVYAGHVPTHFMPEISRGIDNVIHSYSKVSKGALNKYKRAKRKAVQVCRFSTQNAWANLTH